MTGALPSQYDPSGIERDLYQWWSAAGMFQAGKRDAKPFVIMMPPPNVTASLHMGHGLNNTLQDVLARFERMRGRDVLWLPGTDHAGIATQNVVERLLARDDQSRFDLGREAFEQRVWDYVRETGATILEQLEAIGAACDWSRTYFTLDENLSRAVREVFVRLYEKGLIYRGHYLINWCPRCRTALSNEEAEKREVNGKLWHIRYPLAAGGSLTVATTRPETMLGDTAVAVHPSDERYAGITGTEVLLPLTGRRIPVVADEAVDPAFGTGAVKVTPAHDPVDFEIGRRHGLPSIELMTDDARLGDGAPERFRGLDRFDARQSVIAELEAEGLLERVEDHRHAVGHCYRCNTVVEPRLSDQWFVRMAPLAAPALAAWTSGKLRFIPERRGEEYAHWMSNIRDWCISRQLWWGHRIPVWYCDAPECGHMAVTRTAITACPACDGPVRQDEDVLDTWFSSWLVPFSSLGWPEETPDLARFYPGNVLVTAPEILFFWVARMVMAGLEFRGEIPFHTVYLHGTVRDAQHRKMSKSLGNGIDPLVVVEKYGADALRYTVVSGMAVGTDLILDHRDIETAFAPARNFANKLWNLGRFVLGNLSGVTRPLAGDYPDVVRREELQLADRWILARCNKSVADATAAYGQFRLNEAATIIYHFLWSDLADWYIEQIKPRLYGDAAGGEVARAVVATTFDVALRLLHPVMPFITETLWKRLPGKEDDASIMLAPWPVTDDRALDEAAIRDFTLVQECVSAVRGIRAEYNVPPGSAVRLVITRAAPAARAALKAEQGTIERLARVDGLDFGKADGVGAGAVLTDGTSLFVGLGSAIDVKQECHRLSVERDRLAGLIRQQEARLANPGFTNGAPAAVVLRESKKLSDWSGRRDALHEKLQHLGCG